MVSNAYYAIERVWAQPRYRDSLAAHARAFSQRHSWTEASAAYCLAVDELVTSRRTAAAIPSLVQ
jgi:hypothetical protein